MVYTYTLIGGRIHEGVGELTENKRFVSYMYQYHKDEKQNNTGYTRVETRGSQCKIFVHINIPKGEGMLYKAYMFYRKPGKYRFAYLGNMLVSNGVSELKIKSEVFNVMNSDIPLEDMCGVIVYRDRNSYIACEWDGEPLNHTIIDHIENLDLQVSVTSDAKPTVEVYAEKVEESTSKSINEEEVMPELSASEVIIKEISSESLECINVEVEEKSAEQMDEGVGIEENQSDVKEEITLEKASMDLQNCNEMFQSDMYRNCAFYNERNAEDNTYRNLHYQKVEQVESQNINNSKENCLVDVDCIEPTYQTCGNVLQATTCNSCDKSRGRQFECHPIAQNIFRKFQRVYPFEDNEISECVRIEPQDIGLLPIDTWVLGNNSFLLHGYYTYHHLIFGKIPTQTGLIYIIGVPGVYMNRESFMARMFGFEYFKCCKNKEERHGEFGYYYMPVQIG